MHSLDFEGKLVNLSISYDALTVYTKFELTKPIASCMKTCNELDFIHCNENLTEKAEHFKKARFIIRSNNLAFDRNVHREDHDHPLYHQENAEIGFREDDEHFHIKFSVLLSYDHLELILETFVKYELIDDNEKNELLLLFATRQKKNQDLLKYLDRESEKDTKRIIGYISRCDDNDVLLNLHECLLSDEFDYLRELDDLLITRRWQGTDNNGDIVQTSKGWSMIEKSIALKMANNIRMVNITHTPEVCKERAMQLAQYSFFAIKRKADNSIERSGMYQAFQDNDLNGFDKSYEKHFSSYNDSP